MEVNAVDGYQDHPYGDIVPHIPGKRTDFLPAAIDVKHVTGP
jgi:hypothetical protein